MFDLGAAFLERHRGRILYGSDFPNILFPREDEIDTLLGLNLSQEFYDAVFRDNGLRLIRRALRRGRSQKLKLSAASCGESSILSGTKPFFLLAYPTASSRECGRERIHPKRS